MTEDELQSIVRYEVSKAVPGIIHEVAKQIIAVNATLTGQMLEASRLVLSIQSSTVESFSRRPEESVVDLSRAEIAGNGPKLK